MSSVSYRRGRAGFSGRPTRQVFVDEVWPPDEHALSAAAAAAATAAASPTPSSKSPPPPLPRAFLHTHPHLHSLPQSHLHTHSQPRPHPLKYPLTPQHLHKHPLSSPHLHKFPHSPPQSQKHPHSPLHSHKLPHSPPQSPPHLQKHPHPPAHSVAHPHSYSHPLVRPHPLVNPHTFRSTTTLPPSSRRAETTAAAYYSPLTGVTGVSPHAMSSPPQHASYVSARHTLHVPIRYAASTSAASVSSAPYGRTPSVSRNNSYYTDPPKLSALSSLLPLRRMRSSASRARRRGRRRSCSPVPQADRSDSEHASSVTTGMPKCTAAALGSGGNSASVIGSASGRDTGLSMDRSKASTATISTINLFGGKSSSLPRQMAMDDLSQPVTLQGYCRMTWFARLRCTRFLRLIHGSLHCFDAAIRTRLWAVMLQGARVRIHMPHKIVLSKLQCGFLVEFYVYDEQSCKHWASALLQASMLSYTPDVSQSHSPSSSPPPSNSSSPSQLCHPAYAYAATYDEYGSLAYGAHNKY